MANKITAVQYYYYDNLIDQTKKNILIITHYINNNEDVGFHLTYNDHFPLFLQVYSTQHHVLMKWQGNPERAFFTKSNKKKFLRNGIKRKEKVNGGVPFIRSYFFFKAAGENLCV